MPLAQNRPTRPDIVIIGATKCATSWLHLALQKHPEIALVTNETYYFSKHFDEGLDWMGRFSSLFEPDKIWGDYSNDYIIQGERIVPNMLAANREMKLIVALRNPIDRAQSFYKMFFRSKKFGASPAAEVIPGRRIYDEGFYYRNLLPFIEAFGADRLHVVIYEDIKSDDAGVVRDLYRFVGIDPNFQPDVLGQAYNKAQTFRPRSVFLHKLGAKLIDSFAHSGRFGARVKELIRRSPLKKYYHQLNRGEEVPKFSPDFRRQLAEVYGPDMKLLSDWLARDVYHKWITPELDDRKA